MQTLIKHSHGTLVDVGCRYKRSDILADSRRSNAEAEYYDDPQIEDKVS